MSTSAIARSLPDGTDRAGGEPLLRGIAPVSTLVWADASTLAATAKRAQLVIESDPFRRYARPMFSRDDR